jgi:hypothetical protein
VAVYVDDNWTVCDDDSEWDRFHTAWKLKFEESSNVVEAENDFCGVRYDDMPDGSLELSCGKLIHELEAMISEFLSNDNCAMPMVGDALLRMRETAELPLTELIPKARSIVGLGIFIVRGARPDGLFAGIAVSQHIVNNLTPFVWECVLRWATYLVRTRHFRLVFRPPSLVNSIPSFAANSDSSCINSSAGDGGAISGVPDAQKVAVGSMGGYTLFFEGSGVMVVECLSPAKTR